MSALIIAEQPIALLFAKPNMNELQISTAAFLADVSQEIARAREKFPSADASIVALMEEVGELAQALLSKPKEEVHLEAVQVAAMACRVATEVDSLMKSFRTQHGQS